MGLDMCAFIRRPTDDAPTFPAFAEAHLAMVAEKEVYANKIRTKERISGNTDMEYSTFLYEEADRLRRDTVCDVELACWRKHPNLHGWMHKWHCDYVEDITSWNYNCVDTPVTSQMLDALEKDMSTDSLPETTGFFFGESTPSDYEKTRMFIEKAREALEKGLEVYYTSWW